VVIATAFALEVLLEADTAGHRAASALAGLAFGASLAVRWWLPRVQAVVFAYESGLASA
jgi:hypothetical protein